MRRVWRTGAAAVAVLFAALAGGSLSGVAVAGAQGPVRVHVASPLPSSQLTLSLDTLSPAILHPGERLHLSGTVTNPTSTPVSGMHLNISIDSLGIMTSLGDVTAWEATPKKDVAWIAAQHPLGAPVPANGSLPFSIDIDASALGLKQQSAFGARGLVLELSDGSNAVDVVPSFVVWQPDGAPQAALAIMAPVVRTDLSPDSDAQRTRAVVDALAGLDADVAVDGALAQDERYQPTIAALASLRAAGIWVLPWGDTDVAALAHAQGQVLYSDAQALSTDQMVPALGDTSTPVRTSLALPVTLDQPTMDLATAGGADVVLAPASQLAGYDTSSSLTTALDPDAPPADAAPGAYLAAGYPKTPVLVADDGLAQAILKCDPDDGVETQRLYAMAASRLSAGVDSLVLALPEDWNPTAAQGRCLELVRSMPWFEPSSVDAIAAAATAPLTLASYRSSPGEAAGPDVAALIAARNQVAAFAQVTARPAEVLGAQLPSLLSPLSNALRGHTSQRAALQQAALASAQKVTSSVSVLGTGAINFLAKDAAIPVTLRNAYTQDVTVWVQLRISDPRLQAPEGVEATIPAGAETTVRLPVHAVANANVEVVAQVFASPTGTVLASGEPMGVRVRADWEDWGTWSVLGVAGIALIVGLALSTRKRTRAAAIAAAERSAAQGEDAPGPTASGSGTP